MTVIHIVLFKFLPTVSEAHKQTFVRELKLLKNLSCVKDNRLVVGGPSFASADRSKGFEFALVSFHESRAELETYQASEEHTRVVTTYLLPYKDETIVFDFDVDGEDEYLCRFVDGFVGSEK